jgi:hypothetical protein
VPRKPCLRSNSHRSCPFITLIVIQRSCLRRNSRRLWTAFSPVCGPSRVGLPGSCCCAGCRCPRMSTGGTEGRCTQGLLHCCYTVVTLLLHCCYTAVALLLHFCYTAATLLHARMEQRLRDGVADLKHIHSVPRCTQSAFLPSLSSISFSVCLSACARW